MIGVRVVHKCRRNNVVEKRFLIESPPTTSCHGGVGNSNAELAND
jgi:hypothetical protein